RQEGEDQYAGGEGADHGGHGDQNQRRGGGRRAGGRKARDMAVQGLDPFDDGGHGGGVGETAGQGLRQDGAANSVLGGAGRASVHLDRRMAERAARQQREGRQTQARQGAVDALRQGADRQGQTGCESDRRHGVGDDQRPAQRHQPSPRRQRSLQPGARRRLV